MKYIQTKPSRLHCAHCDETLNLPQNGNIRIYKELRCPLDDFELLSWSAGSKGRSFPFCPYCYNNAPFRDMKKGIVLYLNLRQTNWSVLGLVCQRFCLRLIPCRNMTAIYYKLKLFIVSGMGCNSCTHPTCPQGMYSLGVSSCVECETGVLVLDPSSAPKWKLGCNK